MVRIFVLLVTIATFFKPLQAQQNVFSDFSALVWADEFDGQKTDLWRQTTNADELFIIQNGEYILVKKSTVNYGLIFPNENAIFTAHKAEFRLMLDDENEKTATAGVVVMAQQDGKGAFLIEINGKSQYRISKYNGTNFKPINDGWKKDKAIKGRGEYNVISVSMEDRKYDLYINGKLITSFSEVSYKSGKIGLFVGASSSAKVDYVRVFVTSEEKERLRKEFQKEKEAKDDPVLTAVVTKLREQMVQLEIERDSLRVIVEQLKKENERSQGSTSVQKLRAENKDLKAEIARLQKENTQLGKENAQLRDFKETIENGESGDIIITLTKALETERERVSILAAENEKLSDEIKRLRGQR